jgi:hypothetical protein
MHLLETRRAGKVSGARTSKEEKHTLPRDKKHRKSEWGKDWKQRKNTYFLETGRGWKMSEARTGNRGKTGTT